MKFAPHAFSLRQLQYVVAVADTLSFRKAAERCHVSQPSLSAQLAQLEQAVELRLFERDRRRVLLSLAGKEFVERSRQLLAAADDLAAAAQRARDPLQGTLRLGVIPTISPYLLPSATAALRQAFPHLTVVWTEDKTATVIQLLDTGSLDAALLALEADIGDVESAVVARDPFVLATRPGDPLARKNSPTSLDALRDVDVLLLDDGHCFRDQVLSYCSRANARELEFRATSLSTLVHMVAGGAGVTLLPELAVPVEAPRAGLEVRPFQPPVPGRTIALVWRKRSPLGDALRRIARVVSDAYPSDARRPSKPVTSSNGPRRTPRKRADPRSRRG